MLWLSQLALCCLGLQLTVSDFRLKEHKHLPKVSGKTCYYPNPWGMANSEQLNFLN